MRESSEIAELRSGVFFHGAIAGGALVASLMLATFVGWRVLDSALPTHDHTESAVRMRILNEYLETRSIPAGTWASVEPQEERCSQRVVRVEIRRRDGPAARPVDEPEVIDTATFVVFEDSGDLIVEERSAMTAEQLEAEMCG